MKLSRTRLMRTGVGGVLPDPVVGTLPLNFTVLDLFSTNLSAGAINNTPAEPGPCMRTVQDAENKLSISGNKVIINGPKTTPAWGQPGIGWKYDNNVAGLARIAGRTCSFTLNFTSAASNGMRVGFLTSNPFSSTCANGFTVLSSLRGCESGQQAPYGAIYPYTAGIDYECMVVLRSIGAFLLVKSAGVWTLIYPQKTDTTVTVYPGISSNDAFASVANFSVVDLPSPWTDDFGIVTQRLAGVRSAGDTITHAADCLLEFKITTLPSSGNIDYRFRQQDSSNYWQILISSTGALTLNDVVAGTPTARYSSAGGSVVNGDNIVLICYDQNIMIVTGGGAGEIRKTTYATAVNFKTSTAGVLSSLGTGGVVSDMVSWPRAITGAAATILDRVLAERNTTVNCSLYPTRLPGCSTLDYTSVFTRLLAANGKVDFTTAPKGTYLVSNTVLLKNNDKIIGKSGIIIKKLSNFSHVFSNRLASSNLTTKNTAISISNILIDDNNTGTQNGAVRLTANGVLYFYNVDGLTMTRVSLINGDTTLYGIHLENVVNSLVNNYTYVGSKDGFHILSGCDTITLDGFDITSVDDALAINANDWPRVSSGAQDTQNIIIRNGITRPCTGQVGYLLRLVTGSWLAWHTGYSYNIGHLCGNGGNLYKKNNSGIQTGTNAPVHTSGLVTGADGISWMWIGTAVNTTTNLRHIFLKNVTALDGRTIHRIKDSGIYSNSEYPGTEDTSILDDFHTSLSAGAFSNTGLLGTTFFDEP